MGGETGRTMIGTGRAKVCIKALCGAPITVLLLNAIDRKTMELLAWEAWELGLRHVKFKMISRHSDGNIK